MSCGPNCQAPGRWVSHTVAIKLACPLSGDSKGGKDIMGIFCHWILPDYIARVSLNLAKPSELTPGRFKCKGLGIKINVRTLTQVSSMECRLWVEETATGWALPTLLAVGKYISLRISHLCSFWSQSYKGMLKGLWETEQAHRSCCKPPQPHWGKNNKGDGCPSFCASSCGCTGLRYHITQCQAALCSHRKQQKRFLLWLNAFSGTAEQYRLVPALSCLWVLKLLPNCFLIKYHLKH